jgi:hypothetical protein
MNTRFEVFSKRLGRYEGVFRVEFVPTERAGVKAILHERIDGTFKICKVLIGDNPNIVLGDARMLIKGKLEQGTPLREVTE